MHEWHRFCFADQWMKIILLTLSLSVSAFAQGTKPLVQAEIQRNGDTAHVEFRGLKNWRYDLQRDGAKAVSLTVAPVDATSVAKLIGFSDPFVSSVTVDKSGPDGNYVIKFQLADNGVESFDYLTDEPSRLILDFYRKPEEEKKPTAATEPTKSTTPSVKLKGKISKSKKTKNGYVIVDKPADKVSRKPAGDEILAGPAAPTKEKSEVSLHFGIFDGSDDNYDRFRIKDYEIKEDAIIASRQNIYLPFPMLKMPVPVLERLLEQSPELVVHPKETAENKEARLILSLFQRGRLGLYLRTFEHFEKTYPESPYLEILKNSTAHVYIKRWREKNDLSDFEKAQALLGELVQKYPESPLREYNYLLLGFCQFEHGEALPMMQTFEGFIKNYPKSPEIPQVRKALSEAYLILKKFDEATDQLETVMKDYPRTDHAREARYRLGDVQFAKGDYSAAIRTYEAALKDLPKDENIYPNAHFNMAEARFWQKDYKKSLNDYVEFVNLFPTNTYGGYALTRIGELLGILGADPRRVMGAFLESYFRFADHPGAKVARIRMLSQQMRSMKPNELKKALAEIADDAKTVNLPGMEEFTTVMAAEGLTHRGEYKDALEKLITYYQKNPTSPNVATVRGRILRNMANEMKANVADGEFMDALSFYSKYQGTWLKNTDRIDVPYYLAGAYENAGAYGEAQKIYQSALNQRKAIVGTALEKEKKVNEHLPTVAELNLRLASVLVQEREYMDAYQRLKSVGDGSDLEPKENIERVQLSAKVAEQRNDNDKAREALLELAKRWQGDPALVAPVNLQLAQTYLRLGEPKQAETYADRALQAEGGETAIPEKVIAQSLRVKGDALVAQKKDLAGVEAYQKLLERFEDKMPLASVRYKVGQILFDRGDLKGAGEVWKRLDGSPNEFLYKIGKEKIDDSEWKLDYQKYMSRIPAMAKESKK